MTINAQTLVDLAAYFSIVHHIKGRIRLRVSSKIKERGESPAIGRHRPRPGCAPARCHHAPGRRCRPEAWMTERNARRCWKHPGAQCLGDHHAQIVLFAAHRENGYLRPSHDNHPPPPRTDVVDLWLLRKWLRPVPMQRRDAYVPIAHRCGYCWQGLRAIHLAALGCGFRPPHLRYDVASTWV